MPSLLDTADAFRKEEADEVSVTPTAEETGDTLVLSGDWPVRVDKDYGDFIEFFGYSKDEWEVEDPGTMSKWAQSKRLENGDRDVVWLYAYRGVKFRRITDEDQENRELLQEAIERTQTWSAPIRRTLGKPMGEPVTYVHLQGDEQTGAYEGGGIAGLAAREEAALEKSLNYLAQLMSRGVNVEAIADCSTGDRVENIAGHYENQPRMAAPMRDQYRYAVEAEVTRLKAFADFGLPVIAPRTPSNHGEHRAGKGMSPFTSDRDNLDLQIAESVKFVLDQGPLGQQIEWHIPDDDYLTGFDLSGVNCGLTHGHKIPGSGTASIEKWTLAQRDRLAFHHDVKMRVLFMGHKHHLMAQELSGTTVIMAPSLDGGSAWFTASSGQQSTPGLVGLTVGLGHSMGWGNLNPLR